MITSPTIAHDLLVTHSVNFSSRPRFVAFGEIYGGSGHMIALPYSKAWSLRRRFFHDALKPSSIQKYKPRQEAEASIFCSELLRDGGQNWAKLVYRFTASVTFTIGYGRRIESMDASVIKKKLDFVQYSGTVAAPGRLWVETFPWLKNLPNAIAPWKRAIEEKGAEETVFNVSLVNLVRSDLAKSSEKNTISSFTESILSSQQQAHNSLVLSERHLAQLPGSFFTAGFETTASTISSCILALVTYPHVLAILQGEVDALLPISSPDPRSPTFDDKPHLPYLQAFILEVLRWRPAAPLALPHASSKSCVWQGWKIPASTTVIASAWLLNHNPAVFPNPDAFEPARFLSPSHPLYKPGLRGQECATTSSTGTFGWGRRLCPGEALVMNTLFIPIAKCVWGFDIAKIRDVDTGAYEGALLVHPPSFEATFEARSLQHGEILEKEAVKGKTFMEAFEKFD
jgi:cytochrome P450